MADSGERSERTRAELLRDLAELSTTPGSLDRSDEGRFGMWEPELFERYKAARHNEAVNRDRAERAEGLLAEVLWALDNLVKLKDGPRDEVYEREKPLAWQDARRVLSRAEGEGDDG